MSLSKLPANKLLTMTEARAHLFRAAGCEPTCHNCDEPIESQTKFKLATWDDNDVMLCAECTVADLEKEQRRSILAAARYREDYYRRMGRYPGYSRPTQSRS